MNKYDFFISLYENIEEAIKNGGNKVLVKGTQEMVLPYIKSFIDCAYSLELDIELYDKMVAEDIGSRYYYIIMNGCKVYLSLSFNNKIEIYSDFNLTNNVNEREIHCKSVDRMWRAQPNPESLVKGKREAEKDLSTYRNKRNRKLIIVLIILFSIIITLAFVL